MYQALLAGGNTGCRASQWSEREAAAMRWLASLDPPAIVAPSVQRAQGHTLWVPDNDHDIVWRAYAAGKEPKKSPSDLRTAKQPKPLMLGPTTEQDAKEGETIHWIYTLTGHNSAIDEMRGHIQALQWIASGVHCLGWGIDTAVACVNRIEPGEIDQFPGQRWEPLPSGAMGGRHRRVPRADAFDELTRSHTSFMQRLEGRGYRPPKQPGEHAFAAIGYHHRHEAPTRPVAAFALRPAEANQTWFRGNPALTDQIAAMVRHVACQAAQREPDRFPGGSGQYVRGKLNERSDNPARFSYLPLPTIPLRQAHADGLVRRVLIAEPLGGSGEHAAWAAQQLRGRSLIDEKSGQPVAFLEAMASPDPMTRRYLGPAREWASVTPVILPGFDERRQKRRGPRSGETGSPSKAERLVLTALRQAGLAPDAISDLVLRKAPFWPGAHHPSEYHRPAYLDHAKGRQFPAWHVQLRFREPVGGPLALGAGRHCGLGLFAPKPDKQPAAVA
jgi:CRISPR-associated protein Csb2